jgi:hypothetical protein
VAGIVGPLAGSNPKVEMRLEGIIRAAAVFVRVA